MELFKKHFETMVKIKEKEQGYQPNIKLNELQENIFNSTEDIVIYSGRRTGKSLGVRERLKKAILRDGNTNILFVVDNHTTCDYLTSGLVEELTQAGAERVVLRRHTYSISGYYNGKRFSVEFKLSQRSNFNYYITGQKYELALADVHRAPDRLFDDLRRVADTTIIVKGEAERSADYDF